MDLTPQSPTLAEAQQMVDHWIHTYGVRYFSELTNMACLTEEVGELARVMSRKYGDQRAKTPIRRTRWPTCFGYSSAWPTKRAWTSAKPSDAT